MVLVRGGWPALVVALVIRMALPSAGSAAEIGPETNLCEAINSPESGDELILRPGDYHGRCTIRRGGSLGAPLVIRSWDLDRPARILYDGRTGNVIDVKADHVTLRGLEIGPSQRGADGVRVFSRSGVTVEDCRFHGVGGIAVVANHSSIRGLTVRRNVVLSSRSTGMYFGCHDGAGCALSDLLVEANYIHGVDAPDPEIGYGLQVKLNSTGIIRGNVIVNTKGPGIMVYGSTEPVGVSLVERNLVMGSRRSSGIVVGGGPAVVRNNVSILNAEAGIALEDYHRRGLLRSVVVAHNTVYGNGAAGIAVPEHGLADATLANNAVQAPPATHALPREQSGVRLIGNVDCSDAECFVDPAGRDFSPHSDPAVAMKGARVAAPWMPRDDFFGTARSAAPTAGAIERRAGPIPLGVRR